MRKLVQDLLEPTIDRAQKDSEEINRTSKIVLDHEKRVKTVENAFLLKDHKDTMFDKIDERFIQVEINRKLEFKDVETNVEKNAERLKQHDF